MNISLDDEFALFQAELEKIEENNKRNLLNNENINQIKDTDVQEISNKKRKLVEKPQVIFAPPKRFLSPSRVSKNIINPRVVIDPSLIENNDNRTNLNHLTSNPVTSTPAALSGFLPGTTGAALENNDNNLIINKTNIQNLPRMDMVTGRPLTSEEQRMVALQQSAYGYNPNKTISSNNTITSNNIINKSTTSNNNNHSDQRSNNNNVQSAITTQKKKKIVRAAGGKVWEDPTLIEWPDDDYRLFCGDLGNEVTDELLAHAFSEYPSFQVAKVIRDKMTHKSKGYGFASFSDPFDCAKALREMNGKYVGNRPVKIKKSKWEERNLENARKKMKKQKKMIGAANKKKHHLFG